MTTQTRHSFTLSQPHDLATVLAMADSPTSRQAFRTCENVVLIIGTTACHAGAFVRGSTS
jgi:hypothetical protein